MSEHSAVVTWSRGDAPFADNRYSRAHRWTFDGGQSVSASASPSVVPPPMSDPAGVDPEEAFVASLSSCHMLWFLFLAQKGGFVVDRYEDEARGVLGKDAAGRTGVTRVTLRPRVEFSGPKKPEASEVEGMHHEAHERCFIANSVKTEIVVEPR